MDGIRDQRLLAQEKLGATLILPIWHQVTEEDLKQYNLILASRIAKVSESDSYDEIVRSVLKVLGRNLEVARTDDMLTVRPALAQDGTDQRELVAYAWYETKGPDANKEKLYVRRSSFMKGWFVLIDVENE